MPYNNISGDYCQCGLKLCCWRWASSSVARARSRRQRIEATLVVRRAPRTGAQSACVCARLDFCSAPPLIFVPARERDLHLYLFLRLDSLVIFTFSMREFVFNAPPANKFGYLIEILSGQWQICECAIAGGLVRALCLAARLLIAPARWQNYCEDSFDQPAQMSAGMGEWINWRRRANNAINVRHELSRASAHINYYLGSYFFRIVFIFEIAHLILIKSLIF